MRTEDRIVGIEDHDVGRSAESREAKLRTTSRRAVASPQQRERASRWDSRERPFQLVEQGQIVSSRAMRKAGCPKAPGEGRSAGRRFPAAR